MFARLGKLEGPENQGWRKIGFIGCFPLVALLRLARISFNPSETSTSKGCSFLHIKQAWSLPYRGFIFFKTMFLLFLGTISTKIHHFSEANTSKGCSFFHIIQQTCVLPYQGYLFLNTMFLSFLEFTSLEIHYVPPKCKCSLKEVQRNITWSMLSCKWWLFLLSAYWK